MAFLLLLRKSELSILLFSCLFSTPALFTPHENIYPLFLSVTLPPQVVLSPGIKMEAVFFEGGGWIKEGIRKWRHQCLTDVLESDDDVLCNARMNCSLIIPGFKKKKKSNCCLWDILLNQIMFFLLRRVHLGDTPTSRSLWHTQTITFSTFIWDL